MKYILIIFTAAMVLSCANKKKTATDGSNVKEVSSSANSNTAMPKTVPTHNVKKREAYTLQIYKKSCAQVIAQIVSDNKGDLGEDWAPEDARLAKPMSNMIRISNFCVLPKELENQARIKVRFIDKSSNCMICSIRDIAPPKTTYAIEYIEKDK